MLRELELFFMIRAQWLIDGRFRALSNMHSLPAAFYSNNEVELASSLSDLDRIFQDTQDRLLRDGVVRIRPRVIELGDPQKNTFPVLVEFRALDRYGQILFLVRIRFYVHGATSATFRIEMQEEIERKHIAQTPVSPTDTTVVH